MLVEFNVQNVTSFNKNQTFSMLGSTATKEDHIEQNTLNIDKFGVGSILRSAALFGANASGKSNLIDSMQILKHIVLDSLLTADSDTLDNLTPFILKKDFFDIPSELEVSFIKENILYKYGLSISNGEIGEEWLYCNKNIRETKLFHRTRQKLEFNLTSFSEASDFITKDEHGDLQVAKTKSNVPFISVLSQFDGEISKQVVGWFQDLRIISGTYDLGVKGYTLNKFDNDDEFKIWALEILKHFQIEDVIVTDEDNESTDKDKSLNFTKKQKVKKKRVEVLKKVSSEFIRTMPIEMESEGTRRMIYTLGPIYDVIKNNRVLIVDEFDSKFHTLLSKYLIGLFHKNNMCSSQLIITTHDTNLLSKEVFRRDQIWFVEKNDHHESELFSLLEYKEHYTRKSSSYRKDYLDGKYGAIPLFDNEESLEEAIHGEG
jgi:AAA15 family ATPase/GTPase